MAVKLQIREKIKIALTCVIRIAFLKNETFGKIRDTVYKHYVSFLLFCPENSGVKAGKRKIYEIYG